jgi:CIC family chloride channel protein
MSEGAVDDRGDAESDERAGLVWLTVLAVGTGALAGAVGALFRMALLQADAWRAALVAWAGGAAPMGPVVVVAAVAAATAAAAGLVRRFAPYAGGSGIPHVEAVVRGELPHAGLRLLPVKFLGGWLAIGGGLALGREGPSVQMGACLGSAVGRAGGCNHDDRRALLAAGAGAGLATAFNAPTAGAVFVLEELLRRFDARVTIAALAASAGAIATARLVVGDAPDFTVTAAAPRGMEVAVASVAIGLLAGVAGVAYDRAILASLRLADRLARVPLEARAAGIGAAVGVVALLVPGLVGGGDALTQQALSGGTVAASLGLVFAGRFALGAVSYAAGTPGGLFAPLLVLGAQVGLAGAAAWGGTAALTAPESAAAFGMVGMAAFFAAVVRAPLTGIVLVTEMTDSAGMLLPMLMATAVAMLVPARLGVAPIYDALRQRLLQGAGPRRH